MSNLGEKVGCFNMHRFNLSMHILHVFIQEIEIFFKKDLRPRAPC